MRRRTYTANATAEVPVDGTRQNPPRGPVASQELAPHCGPSSAWFDEWLDWLLDQPVAAHDGTVRNDDAIIPNRANASLIERRADVVASHHGTITITDGHLGGATFTVEIPMAQPDTPPSTATNLTAD